MLTIKTKQGTTLLAASSTLEEVQRKALKYQCKNAKQPYIRKDIFISVNGKESF